MSAMGTMGAALPGLVGMTQAISAANAHPRAWNHASSIAEPKWHAGSSDKAKQDIADDEISNYAIRQQSFVQQMSEFVWQHQNEGWAKALMMTLTGFNEAIHSPVGEALVGGLVRDERVNPLVSGTEMMTSTDPYTGLPVDRLPAGVDFVFGVANLFSDGLASGIAAGMPRASAGLRSAGGWVSNRYGVFFGRGGSGAESMSGAGLMELDPHSVRFSQRWVSYGKSKGVAGYTYSDIVDSMKTEGWKDNPIDVIRM